MKLYTVDSRQPDNRNALLSSFFERQYTLDDIGDFHLRNRIKTLLDRRVPFFPPTMCPADARDGELENILWAVDYYKRHGIDQIALQPKMMGSRCVVILRESLDDSFAISKNGYVINHVDLKNEIAKLHNRCFVGPETILDCELMPWSALGKGLIDRSFHGFGSLIANELVCEQDYGFDDMWKSIRENPQFSILQQDANLPKKEFIQKHGHHKYCVLKYYLDYDPFHIDSNTKKDYLKKFIQSLSHYDNEYEPSICPFAVLKSGPQILFPNDVFGPAKSWTLKIDDIESILQIRDLLNKPDTEGLVIKPLNPIRNIAPYFKVRNREYLRLVYGYDYDHPSKLAKLIKNKRIDSKLRTSIEQWNMCYDLLHGKSDHESIFCKYFHNPEPEMDPRL